LKPVRNGEGGDVVLVLAMAVLAEPDLDGERLVFHVERLALEAVAVEADRLLARPAALNDLERLRGGVFQRILFAPHAGGLWACSG
jgi:hypothetical protein